MSTASHPVPPRDPDTVRRVQKELARVEVGVTTVRDVNDLFEAYYGRPLFNQAELDDMKFGSTAFSALGYRWTFQDGVLVSAARQ